MPAASTSSRPARTAGARVPAIVRSLVFNLGLWTWTLLMVLAALPLILAPPRVMVAHARVWEHGIHALLGALVGLRHEVRDPGGIATTRAIFAFKHQSAWETLTVHLLLPDPVIALKQELTRIPLFGRYLMHAGMIRIDRGSGARALRSMIEGGRAALARGSSLVVFPEGTRVAPGERRPYHPGVAALYLHLKCPVVPVALNSGVFWSRRSFLKRPGRIVVEFLPAIPPGLDRREFMATLEDRLEAATARLVAEAEASLTPS